MAKIIDKVRLALLDEVVSSEEMENVMEQHGYYPVETEDDEDESDKDGNMIIKFTNYKGQIWVKGIVDEEKDMLVAEVTRVNKVESEATKVDPFHSYKDLEKVLNYLRKKNVNHWLTACLMAALGRRVGDTVALKWSDIFQKDGEYHLRLTQLKEEKTKKRTAPRINAYAKVCIDEYIAATGIDPLEHYDEEIICTGAAAFRRVFKEAVGHIGFNYPLSTHSLRKWYGNTLYKLHPQDADNLQIIQMVFGHSDVQTTKVYVGYVDEKIDKYNDDYADYMLKRANGETCPISNSPIISLKGTDFRELLSRCWDMAQNGEDKFKVINELIGKAEIYMV